MFITKTEWATEWGGAKSKDLRTPFKRLPFYCCALTFTPFDIPVCTKYGCVFDTMHIIPYIRKYGKNPVTGAPLKLPDLVPLNFHKNSEGEFHCPVLNKVFTEFTHIVAVKTSGNVLCYEAGSFFFSNCDYLPICLNYLFSRMELCYLRYKPPSLPCRRFS
ncbi:peptidyl-prolyl cis-trans isomerase CYP65-like [Silene latifolia]|uniref:peptidyl-prolyl cis-trans isomerase CYP65-like n=1 Tax=Silene latifolia TaxID=37657 RepID=UPI003D76BC82